MPFLPDAQKAVNDPATPNDVRLTLQFLIAKAQGRHNAKPIHDILHHLASNGVHMGASRFQTTILAGSREGDVFIGSGQHGYFLIVDIDDARATLEFYESRIASEVARIAHLKQLALANNWTI